MDVFDRATEVEDAYREAAIAAQLAQAKRPNQASASHCEDCNVEIPEQRRVILPGVLLCVDCQSIHEQLGRK
ncbi:TraR/DksA family transcriptional regulator [Pseudomonas gregormendelii]|uniref:TraR/DksA family transcriptional regulator n=1 Tax=Pseudomonas gregormendelii TaxID=1628277 RepID=A0ABS3AP16_9PSED|nr:TraR/DksA family transcriptional regulator [Pseudomonas gregormendelii]MBN3968531.1 TraR/DksA family transcriptional regulator [Pseudomonas gregormendelii]